MPDYGTEIAPEASTVNVALLPLTSRSTTCAELVPDGTSCTTSWIGSGTTAVTPIGGHGPVLTCCVSVTTNASPRTPAAGVTGPSHAAEAGSMTIAVTLSSPLVMDGTWTPCELTVVSVTGRPFGGAVKLFEQPAVAISIAAHIEHVRRMVSPRGESGRHGRRIVRPAASAGADSRCHDAEPVRNGFGVASHLVRRSQADRFAY